MAEIVSGNGFLEGPDFPDSAAGMCFDIVGLSFDLGFAGWQAVREKAVKKIRDTRCIADFTS